MKKMKNQRKNEPKKLKYIKMKKFIFLFPIIEKLHHLHKGNG